MKLIISILLVCVVSQASTQTLTFEDPDFLSALIAEGIDSNEDGLIQVTEAEDVLEIDIYGKDFKSIKGIEGFSNLEYLIIGGNDLIDSIDVLGLTSLKLFRFLSNLELEYVNVSGHPSLEEIIFSGDGSGNLDQMKSINISNIPTLKSISIKFMRVINTIEIYDNDNLENLAITYNAVLPSVDVSDLKSLQTLWFHGNFDQIITGELPLLEEYRWNLKNPANLDLTLYPILKRLYIQPEYSDITKIDIFDHPVLEEIYITVFFNLNSVRCSNLKSLQSIWIQQSNELKSVTLDSLSSVTEIYFQGLNDLRDLSITNALELEELSVYGDKLKDVTLYNLPAVTDLSVYANRIEELDLSTVNALTDLSLNSTSIEQLFIKNNTNENLDCTNCESLLHICSDETDTYQNIPPQVFISTFCPHTADGNPNEISGNILFDYGSNGCGLSAVPIPFANIDIYKSDSIVGLVTSNSTGKYGLFFNQDTFDLKPSDNVFNTLFNFVPDNVRIMPNDTLTVRTQDFCIEAVEEIIDLEIVLIDPDETRPGEEATYTLLIRNVGSTIPQGKITLFYEGELITFVASDPSPQEISTTILEWDVPFLAPFEETEFKITFLLNTPMDTFPLNGGDTLKFQVQGLVNFNSNETRFSNTLCDVVVNSFDPNDKHCLQGGALMLENLEDYLFYKIRFENLGTADARNIVIQDTLDSSSYNINSFQLVSASHEVRASIDRNIVSFIFEGIDLGFTDDENDGYVIFKIKPINNLHVGYEINNEASIYFDYNFPIHTNVAQTIVIDDITSIDSEKDPFETLQFYPSPCTDVIYLNDESFSGEVTILDVDGKIIAKKDVSLDHSIDLKSLKSGIYFIALKKDNQRVIRKIVKI